MGWYAERTKRPPRTLTDAEQVRILKVSGEHRDGFRDHLIISLALGTGMRECEIVGLDVDDVTADGRRPRRSIRLRVFKDTGAPGMEKAQRVTLPDGTFYKLEKYLRSLPRARKKGPLFISRFNRRLSERRLRSMFRGWQQRAGFDHLYCFHELRHTAITNFQREGRDIRATQKYA